MKYHYTILVIFFLTVLQASAQYIDVHAGWAIPSGSFSNSNLSKPEDGFAQSGASFGFGVNYPVYKKLGVCVKFNYNTFGFNATEYSAQANDQASQGTTLTITTGDHYKSSSAFAGAYLSFGKKKLTLDIHVVAGFVSLKSPSLLSTSTYAGNTYTQTLESYNDVSPAIGYGFTLKYLLPKNVYATLHMDNVNANIQFPKYGYQSSSEDIFTKPYQAYSFAIGLGYKIQ
jgi:hypothetical protein